MLGEETVFGTAKVPSHLACIELPDGHDKIARIKIPEFIESSTPLKIAVLHPVLTENVC